jgi:hypothetical protein
MSISFELLPHWNQADKNTSLLIIFMFFVPESPRWTAKQDDWERTTQIIVRLRG